jgi:hypothetical protein
MNNGAEPITSLAERRKAKLDAELAKLSKEDRTRFETLKTASDLLRKTAHEMLDSQLDQIMPELMSHIDMGGTFAVLVVDPQKMPIMPEPAPPLKIVDLDGKLAKR